MMKGFALGAVLAALLAGCLWIAAGAQPKPHASSSAADECPSATAARSAFHNFGPNYPLLTGRDLRELEMRHRSAFGHSFVRRGELDDIAALFSVYGYDFIGSLDGYMLFYRRPVAWVQVTSVPRLSAPNGELLPQLSLPGDLDPEWPSPSIIAHTAPFLGAIVLPQQIVAYPCG